MSETSSAAVWKRDHDAMLAAQRSGNPPRPEAVRALVARSVDAHGYHPPKDRPKDLIDYMNEPKVMVPLLVGGFALGGFGLTEAILHPQPVDGPKHETMVKVGGHEAQPMNHGEPGYGTLPSGHRLTQVKHNHGE